MTDPLIVLVHGAWGSPGLWELVTPEIDAAGLDYAVADLPSMQSATGTMADDVEHVRSLVAGRPCVLVGHSYGGAVITEAAGGLDDVRHLVYLASLMLDEGESAFDWLAKRPIDGPPLDFRDDGTAMVTRWGDPERDSEQALRLLDRNPPRPFAFGCAITPLSVAPWRTVASTFVVANDDTVIHPDTQREVAVRASRTLELEGDHFPHGEQPTRVAAIIVEAARA